MSPQRARMHQRYMARQRGHKVTHHIKGGIIQELLALKPPPDRPHEELIQGNAEAGSKYFEEELLGEEGRTRIRLATQRMTEQELEEWGRAESVCERDLVSLAATPQPPQLVTSYKEDAARRIRLTAQRMKKQDLEEGVKRTCKRDLVSLAATPQPPQPVTSCKEDAAKRIRLAAQRMK